MSVQGIVGVLTLIVVVGGITTVVSRPNSAVIINQLGTFFANALRVAMGGK